jgi:ferritin-like metal-binding protein YciE
LRLRLFVHASVVVQQITQGAAANLGSQSVVGGFRPDGNLSGADTLTSGFATGEAPPNNPIKERTAMGLFTKDIKSMDDLFVHQLRDIYYAEKQITKALPEMIQKANDQTLKQGFQTHLRETENHVKRLDQVFELLGKKAAGVDCPAIDGIVEEAEDVAGEVENKNVLDAALIAAAQAVEHYEMTRYGTLIAWAKQLGHSNVVPLLNQTLDEEKATDKKLTEMAEAQVNRRAA